MKALNQACAAILLLGLTALPRLAHAEIPGPVEAMIKSAAATGDEAQLKAVVKAAKATNPGIEDEIDALAKTELAAAQTKAEAERHERGFSRSLPQC